MTEDTFDDSLIDKINDDDWIDVKLKHLYDIWAKRIGRHLFNLPHKHKETIKDIYNMYPYEQAVDILTRAKGITPAIALVYWLRHYEKEFEGRRDAGAGHTKSAKDQRELKRQAIQRLSKTGEATEAQLIEFKGEAWADDALTLFERNNK